LPRAWCTAEAPHPGLGDAQIGWLAPSDALPARFAGNREIISEFCFLRINAIFPTKETRGVATRFPRISLLDITVNSSRVTREAADCVGNIRAPALAQQDGIPASNTVFILACLDGT
jgi:hypothetical protein